MNIFINGQSYQTQAGPALSEILLEKEFKPPFAVALNGTFVSRGSYPTTQLEEGDKLEVLTPVQGG